VRVGRGKGNKERVVPVEAALLAVIDDYLDSRATRFPRPRQRGRGLAGWPHTAPLFVGRDGQRLTRGTLQSRLRRAFRLTGQPGSRQPGALAHALRHTVATELAKSEVSVYTLMNLLGHYAGDLVKWLRLGGCVVESGEQSVEHFLAAELSFVGGVVALCLQGGAEFDGGLEEGDGFADGFADGFEVAIEADGAGAVAVAEHAGGAPDDATAAYLHCHFEPTARTIDGLERALAGLGLLDQALAVDLRKPQDYFRRVWSTAFRATDLADTASTAHNDNSEHHQGQEACA
jgi:Phage integrase family